MWTVVYIAPSMEEADEIKRLLSSEGLLVKIKNIDSSSGMTPNSSIEILVPESEADEAMEIIDSI
ncbi:MAG TPA: glutamate decarboxylase [Desulfotomaculum sp.]|nr:MAG: Uncharacterized protein XD84_0817 [Desulfotomaculum sp. 46_80]KUK85033.1 MAG: Uncharacterized protein XE00_0384 [Desulfofundulus kuznetsovii]HAG10912.1 glutamate decarboxylase [Desulfotomaculum sp.]HBY03981.1 glutamate decarboxylase [Desulfotomaculum sp.]